MQTGAEFADWWDRQREIARADLDQFIVDHPDAFGIAVAGSLNTAMDVAAPTVDAARFGTGFAEGTWGGALKDVGRGFTLIGPLGKGGAWTQNLAHRTIARFVKDTGGPICGWISGARALTETGTKLFVTVEDVAKAANIPMSKLGVSKWAQRVVAFEKLGAKIAPLKNVRSFDDVEKAVPRDGSVVLFNIFAKKKLADGGLKDFSHALYAHRDALGGVKIMDDIGTSGRSFSSLAEVAKARNLIGVRLKPDAAVLVNVWGKILNETGNLGVLVMGARVLTGLTPENNKVLAQAFEIYRKVLHGQPLPQRANDHIVAPGESLSSIAARYYENQAKWPLLYEANKLVIGDDPNKIKAGLRLKIPELPAAKEFNAIPDRPASRPEVAPKPAPMTNPAPAGDINRSQTERPAKPTRAQASGARESKTPSSGEPARPAKPARADKPAPAGDSNRSQTERPARPTRAQPSGAQESKTPPSGEPARPAKPARADKPAPAGDNNRAQTERPAKPTRAQPARGGDSADSKEPSGTKPARPNRQNSAAKAGKSQDDNKAKRKGGTAGSSRSDAI